MAVSGTSDADLIEARVANRRKVIKLGTVLKAQANFRKMRLK